MPTANWKRLGELLVRRRIELDPRYANRHLFTAERGINYRIASDIERGRRDNYEDATITAAEVAYRVAPGSIAAVLDGGDLEPLPEPRNAPVPLRPAPAAADPAERAAAAVLADVLPRYEDDELVQALGTQPDKTAVTRVLELRFAKDPGLDREVLASLLGHCRDDGIAQRLGRRRGTRDDLHTAEVLDWLGSQYPYQPAAHENNGTAG